MARPLRIEYPKAWYHVTCRANEKRNIFRKEADRDKLLEMLFAKLYRIEHSYVLMGKRDYIGPWGSSGSVDIDGALSGSFIQEDEFRRDWAETGWN